MAAILGFLPCGSRCGACGPPASNEQAPFFRFPCGSTHKSLRARLDWFNVQQTRKEMHIGPTNANPSGSGDERHLTRHVPSLRRALSCDNRLVQALQLSSEQLLLYGGSAAANPGRRSAGEHLLACKANRVRLLLGYACAHAGQMQCTRGTIQAEPRRRRQAGTWSGGVGSSRRGGRRHRLGTCPARARHSSAAAAPRPGTSTSTPPVWGTFPLEARARPRGAETWTNSTRLHGRGVPLGSTWEGR